MANYKAEYTRFMDSRGIKYQILNNNIVNVRYSAENVNTIDVLVSFDTDGQNLVQIGSYGICSFKEDSKYPKGLVICNELNNRFRWVKFYLDSDRAVNASIDALVDLSSVGSECAELVSRLVNIVDTAYPELMKTSWS